jgi:iron complex outermembrane recepter protein
LRDFAKFMFVLLFVIFDILFSASGQTTSLNDTVSKVPDTIFCDLDEIVTSATRVSQHIIDIPYSVMRINYPGFRYERKIGSDNLLSAVPGLFLQSRYGDHDVRFSIRGFGSRSNSGVRGIRILFDNIPESDADGQSRLEALDFNSIDRIEISRGNVSSLYTNAPGGVANFVHDLDFEQSSVVQYNQFGSFGLHENGFKAAVKTEKYRFLATYSYMNYDGYRQHNNEYWHIVNLALETSPLAHAKLSILGYFVDGAIKLPGSLTKSEFDEDPYQANQRSVDQDEKRLTTKGRICLKYVASFGGNLNNEVEVYAYGSIKFLEHAAQDYRIINRYGLGLSARYINKSSVVTHNNEFLLGGDIFSQPARTEFYENIHGAKGNQIFQVESEIISNTGIYVSDNFEILKEKMFVMLTCRYDHVLFKQAEETLPSRTDIKPYNSLIPKLSLNYKLTPVISIYTSYGLSFDAPAASELDSPDPEYLFNHSLKPQKSGNFEVGIKGNRCNLEKNLFRKLTYEATLFQVRISNEIIPYEVLGEVYYRNAAMTNRIGAEFGAQLEIVRNLDFGISYTWSHFDYLTCEVQTVKMDSLGNPVTSNQDFAGNIEPSIPVNNLFTSLAYTYPVGNHVNIYVKASYQGISGMYVDDANTDKTKKYNLLNFLVGTDLRFGKFNLMASCGINNIFDEIYVGFTNTNSADKHFYEAGAPRNYFVSLNLGYTF